MLDVAAAYPNNECVYNISKETTKREICEIEGILEETYRAQGINLSGGRTNATEYCQTMFGLPHMDKMLAHYKGCIPEPITDIQLETKYENALATITG